MSARELASWRPRSVGGAHNDLQGDTEHESRRSSGFPDAAAPSPSTPADCIALDERWALENAFDDPDTLKKEVMQQTTRRLACERGDAVSSRHRELLNKLENDSGNLISVLQSRKPVSLLLRKKRILVLLALCCLAIAYQITETIINLATGGHLEQYQHFRFVALDPPESTIPDFHLMHNGCFVSSVITADGARTLVRSTDQPQAINGWIVDRYRILAAFDPANTNSSLRGTPLDLSSSAGPTSPGRREKGDSFPRSFRLEASRDMQGWVTVASSRWRHSTLLKTVFLDGIGAAPALDDRGLSVLDMRPAAGLAWYHLVGGGTRLVLLLLVLGFACYGKARRAATILVHSLMVDAVVAVVALMMLSRSASRSILFRPAVFAVYSAYAFTTLRVRPRRVIQVCLGAGLLPLAVVIDLTVLHDDPSSIPLETPPQALVLLLLGLVGVVRRYYLLACAKQNIRADRERYKQAWTECGGRRNAAAQEAYDRDLADVTSLLSTASARIESIENGKPRHLVWIRNAAEKAKSAHRQSTVVNLFRRRSNSVVDTNGSMGSPLIAEFEQGAALEVSDLDQAYLQAHAVDPFFRTKVWQWAKASRGMVRVKTSRSGVDSFRPTRADSAAQRAMATESWPRGRGRGSAAAAAGEGGSAEEEVQRGDARYMKATEVVDGDRIVWADLKGVDRAMDKVEACYEGKPSRLVDLCRQRLVFSSIHELLICLQTIMCDQSVIVRGVKNGLRAEYHGEWSGGFRAVVLNLSLLSPQTVALCLSLHVCELQLVLLPVAQVLASADHASYRIFRNALALKSSSISHSLGSRLFSSSDGRLSHSRATYLRSFLRIFGRRSLAPPSSSGPASLEEGRTHGIVAGKALSGKRMLPSELFAQSSFRTALSRAHTAGSNASSLGRSDSGVDEHRLKVQALSRARRMSSLSCRMQSQDREVEPKAEYGPLEKPMERLVAAAARKAGGMLDSRVRVSASAAVRGASVWSTFFTAAPVATTVTLFRVRSCLLVAAMALIGGAAYPFSVIVTNGRRPVTGLRVWVGGAGVDSGDVTLGHVSLLWNACERPEFLLGWNASEEVVDGGRLKEVQWTRAKEANGWVALLSRKQHENTTDAGSGGQEESTRIQVWVQGSEGAEWECGVPEELQEPRRECEMTVQRQQRVPSAASGAIPAMVDGESWAVDVDLRPKRAEWVWGVGPLLDGVGLLVAALMGQLKKEDRAVWGVTGMQFTKASALVAAALLLRGAHAQGSMWGVWLCHAAVSVGYGVLLVLKQRWWVPMQAVVSFLQLLLLSLVYWPQGPLGWRVVALLGDALLVVACGGVAVCRWAVQASSLRLIAQDKERYDEIWREVVQADGEDGVLESLREVVADFNVHHAEEPRQRRPIRSHLHHLGLSSAAPFASDATGLMPNLARAISGPISNRGYSPRALALAKPFSSLGARKPESEMVCPQAPLDVAPSRRASDASSEEPHCGGEAGVTQAPLASPRASRTSSAANSVVSSGQATQVSKEHAPWVGSTASLRRRWSEAAPLPPVRSLDQIFAQATVMHHLLVGKAKAWAVQSEGMVRVRGGGFRKWGEMVGKEGLALKCRWADMKSEDRAIEKQLRSYRGDPSRLVDVCRQALVFSSPRALQECLKTIMDDPDVVIIRIKNRLDPQFDAHESAGYRDVLLNLRVVTPLTRSLFLDRHVCEVQLLLQQFANLKSNEGHKRYVQFRNSTCS